MTVSATQSEDIKLIAIGGSVGGTAGVAGSAAVNVIRTRRPRASATTPRSPPATTSPCRATDTTDDPLDGRHARRSAARPASARPRTSRVINKNTTASVGANATLTIGGNLTVDATSSEDVTSISVGASFGGTAAVTVNAAVPVLDDQHERHIGSGATVNADGSVRVAADEKLKLDVIAGNISGGGTAAVGASVAVPIVHKETHAFIGTART